MTERELIYVKTIADEGSISKAAQKLYLSQPSLSHCVQRIEESLGANKRQKQGKYNSCQAKVVRPLPQGLRRDM